MPQYWKYIIFEEHDREFEGYKLDNYKYECKEMYHELIKKIACIPEQYVLMWENTHNI